MQFEFRTFHNCHWRPVSRETRNFLADYYFEMDLTPLCLRKKLSIECRKLGTLCKLITSVLCKITSCNILQEDTCNKT
jgi:hypothetical protein